MTIRFFGRHDARLLTAFSIAIVIVFARPLEHLLDVARQLEAAYGLSLLPALLILSVVFVFHQQSKRQETHAAAVAAAAEARQAEARSRELEHLVDFGHALARALDLDAVREASWRHLPALLKSCHPWVLIRERGRWQGLIGASRIGVQDSDGELHALADAVLTGAPEAAAAGDRARQICFPLHVGQASVGVLGVERGADDVGDEDRRLLAAVAALLAIAVRNVQLFAEIRDNALHDSLTGCFTRRFALDLMEAELRRAHRSELPISIVMLDVDHFKRVNDEHGHLAGDAVLAAVGRRLREILRSSDVKCRYGGEEFLIVLPDTPLPGARHVAEWLRRELSELAIEWNDVRLPVTASFGVTSALPTEKEIGRLIERADAAMYRAKQEGRNRVCAVAAPDEAAVVPPLAGTQDEAPAHRPVARPARRPALAAAPAHHAIA